MILRLNLKPTIESSATGERRSRRSFLHCPKLRDLSCLFQTLLEHYLCHSLCARVSRSWCGCLLVKAADGVSEAYCWIEDLFEKLSGFTQRLEGYLDGEMSVYLHSNLIAILSCLLGILGECEKVLKMANFANIPPYYSSGRMKG